MTMNTDQINSTSTLSCSFDRDVEFTSTFPVHIAKHDIVKKRLDSFSVSHPYNILSGNFPTSRDPQLNAIHRAQASDLSSSYRLRGWGSDASRASYVCLTILDSMSLSPARRPEPIVGEGWGYFVDTNNQF